MTPLDYAGVREYWSQAKPSALGPYMMDGFGFPTRAGQFRFREEAKIVRRLIEGMDRDGAVLDLGAGSGSWSAYFAQEFARVVAIEGSAPLFDALVQRCVRCPNVETIHGDVMSVEPEGSFAMVFMGGLLMYLNDHEVAILLQRIAAALRPDGVILCRETTVREGIVMRQGEYQAMYRSAEIYARIFDECSFSVVRCEMNVPYVLIQMGCELIKKWTKFVPKLLQMLPVVGRSVYWGLRAGYPWITRAAAACGFAFPELTNHFFLLRPQTPRPSHDQARDVAA